MSNLSSGAGSQTLIIATAGHVDHGKTSLVKLLTGTDTDTLADEKARGLTINLGYAYHHFIDQSSGEDIATTLGFVDVPGHTDFINNMLAGVGGVDCALLIVAADDGIMPQTKEHLAVLDLLGIATGVVVITKIDKADGPQLEQVKRDVLALIEPTTLAASPLFAVSSITHTGIDELKAYLESLPAKCVEDPAELEKHRARYLIDRSFSAKGIGTVVTGILKAGTIAVGDSLLNTQTNELARVKSLRLDTTDVPRAVKGQRVAANLSADLNTVSRGAWLIDPSLANPAVRIDVKLKFLDSASAVRSSAQYHLHIGASHRLVTIHCLDKATQLYQLKLNAPLFCHYGDRFVIRDPASAHTIGGGLVLDTFVPRRQRAGEERIAMLQALDAPDSAALTSLVNSQSRGVDMRQFALARNLSTDYVTHLIKDLAASVEILKASDSDHQFPIVLGNTFFGVYRATVINAVNKFQQANPSQQGVSEPALSSSCNLPGDFRLFQRLVAKLISNNELHRSGTLLHTPGHTTALSREEQEFLAKVRPILSKHGKVPPRTRELVDLTGIALAPLERILKQTTKAGNLIQVADNRHYLPETILELAELTERLSNDAESDDGFSVIEFRDLSGIGRNLCIEILEYFDGVGFTRRDGNSRIVRTLKENVFNGPSYEIVK
jgi:selenocysteine-specific elongation factor